MKNIAVCTLLMGLGLFAVGCEKKAEVKTESTVTTPEGSTTVTESKAVETTGENPPPAEAK